MKSTGRYYLIPLIFAILIVLVVMFLLPKPERLANMLSGAVTAQPYTGEAPQASAAPTPAPVSESTPAPTPETLPDAAEGPALPAAAGEGSGDDGGNDGPLDGGGAVSRREGLYDVGGYTYYFYGDGTAAVNEVVSVDGREYAFDEKGRWMSPLRQAVEASALSQKTDQLVLAVDHELTFWEKAKDGSWRLRLETLCGYGANGLVPGEERVMGSKTTPIGAFPLTLAFGTGENPGTAMTYRQITENSYWSEVEDESFNTWVESETPVPGEHLADYYQYKYAVNIGFNLEDIVYSRGCAIFLHVKSRDSWNTAGCVSLSEEDMLTLLSYLRDGAYILIVPDAESIAEY